jgi:hypothetical protein
MAAAIPTVVLTSLLAAANPNIETAPYVGSGEFALVGCRYQVDGVGNQYVPRTSRADGDVCVIPMPSTLKDGSHIIKVRFVFTQSQGAFSKNFGFRRESTADGSTVWSWDNTLVCDPDCQGK